MRIIFHMVAGLMRSRLSCQIFHSCDRGLGKLQRKPSYELAPNREEHFEIDLKQHQPPPLSPIICLSNAEMLLCHNTLDDFIQKELIRPSSSHYGAPVYLVKTKRVSYVRYVVIAQ